jgi:hypothetical protein
MGVLIPTPTVPANPLASLIVEHEEEALFALSEVALYRYRAEELRLEAHLTNWSDVRERLLKLAEQYEILADSLERDEGISPAGTVRSAKMRGSKESRLEAVHLP